LCWVSFLNHVFTVQGDAIFKSSSRITSYHRYLQHGNSKWGNWFQEPSLFRADVPCPRSWGVLELTEYILTAEDRFSQAAMPGSSCAMILDLMRKLAKH